MTYAYVLDTFYFRFVFSVEQESHVILGTPSALLHTSKVDVRVSFTEKSLSPVKTPKMVLAKRHNVETFNSFDVSLNVSSSKVLPFELNSDQYVLQ